MPETDLDAMASLALLRILFLSFSKEVHLTQSCPFDGAFKTGCFTQLDGKRPLNALYTSLLRASGVEVDRYNMSEKMAAKFDSGTGPLKEVMA